MAGSLPGSGSGSVLMYGLLLAVSVVMSGLFTAVSVFMAGSLPGSGSGSVLMYGVLLAAPVVMSSSGSGPFPGSSELSNSGLLVDGSEIAGRVGWADVEVVNSSGFVPYS